MISSLNHALLLGFQWEIYSLTESLEWNPPPWRRGDICDMVIFLNPPYSTDFSASIMSTSFSLLCITRVTSREKRSVNSAARI